MIDVRVIFSDNNRRFKVIRAYDGFELHKSGRYKNKTNANLGVKVLMTENSGWRLDRMIHV